MAAELETSFPPAGALPARFRLDRSQIEPVYVVEGRVETWPGATQDVLSPVCVRGAGGSLDPVSLGPEAHIDAEIAARAVDAAVRAWDGGLGAWPAASAAERIAAVERFAAAIEDDAERVATLLALEIGKPYPSAKKEIDRSIEYIRGTNAVMREIDGAARATFTGTKGTTIHYAREGRDPLGVVLCVAPFNYPVNELLTTVIPALLMGNVVIAKTPRFGMLANLALADAFARCFPAGAVALLPGSGRAVIPEVMRATRAAAAGGDEVHGIVDMLAFIGSEAAADAILGHHPSPVSLHKVLGLGSKNAAVLLPGADHERAVAGIVKGALGFNGQRCTAEKIVFVPRAEADAFVDRFTAAVEALAVGMPWDDGVDITPLPEPGKPAWMREYIDEAVEAGAEITNAGGGDAAATLMRPAVLYPVAPTTRIYREEQFGPIVPIVRYEDVAEVVRWQQSSPYGQQIGIWGPRDDARGLVRAMRPQVARINVNDICQRGPDSFGFTATDKSGFGILSLRDALTTFSRPVLVQSTDERALLAATSAS